MNMHVRELTPTEQAIAERRRNFKASIAAKAAELREQKTKAKLAAIQVAAVETPLIRTPEVKEAEAPLGLPWFYILASEPVERSHPTISDIKRAVCRRFNVTHNDLVSHRRTASITLPRQIAVYLCKQLTPFSYPMIGKNFGGRDHCTQIHAAKKIKRMVEEDPQFAAVISELLAELGGEA